MSPLSPLPYAPDLLFRASCFVDAKIPCMKHTLERHVISLYIRRGPIYIDQQCVRDISNVTCPE